MGIRDAGFRAEEVNRAAPAAYSKVGLSLNDKGFRNQRDFDAWGAFMEGRKNVVGWKPEKRWALSQLIFNVVSEGRVERSMLENLGGCLVQAFMFNRPCMSGLHHYYKYLAELQRGTVVSLPSQIADEMLAAALLLPLAVTHVDDPISSELLATDATPGRGGRVRAHVPDQVAINLMRLAEQRGANGRLDWSAADEALIPSPLLGPFPGGDNRAASLRCKVRSSWNFEQSSQINPSEARALKSEARDLCNQVGQHKMRRIIFPDSRVVTGAGSKGGSSSFEFNGILRSCLGYCVCVPPRSRYG